MQIAMEGREAADQWKRDTQNLNDRTDKLLREVSTLLQTVKDFSDGTLVDEIFNLGSTVIDATTKLMEGLNQIFGVVDQLLGLLGNLFESVSSATKTLVDTISSI